MAEKPGLLSSIARMKCPNCRKGNMFLNKSILPLGEMMKMPEQCPVCGQKMELEPGFYYGTGYVSYGLSVAIAVFNIVWFVTLVGLVVPWHHHCNAIAVTTMAYAPFQGIIPLYVCALWQYAPKEKTGNNLNINPYQIQ
jgi:uncharacterized protein (DUF983 family)